AFAAHLTPLRKKNWFVYAKRPFAGPEAVLAYLSRYTHRVAISNSRLIALDRRGVSFRVKDYRRNGRERTRSMTLDPGEFIRRFLLHVLPKGFHRIRHYGLLASATRKANIVKARDLLAKTPPQPAPVEPPDTTATAPVDHRPPCPLCGGLMITIETFEPRYTQRAQPRAPPRTGRTARTGPP
ncbi:MAG: transposase, partial [Pseudomonadota bacterium]|nr:transposase [Pseudomonadota bacterium]